MFIVKGDVELQITDYNGVKHVLDTLHQGSCIGQYSVLYEEPFIFTAIAKSFVRFLILDQAFFVECRNQINRLDEAIYRAEEHVEDFGIPCCDFIHYERNPPTSRQRFRNVINHIKVIHKGHKQTQSTFMEVIKEVHKKCEQKEKKASSA